MFFYIENDNIYELTNIIFKDYISTEMITEI